MKYLKQRTPLTFDKQGNPLLINKEFGDDIERLVATGSSSGSIDVVHLSNQISALTILMTDLTNRVRKLEGGYQA